MHGTPDSPTRPVDAAGRPSRVQAVTTSVAGFEGEGFPVRRAFAGVPRQTLDPFLHLDELGPVTYPPTAALGTDWHPHRGFETVTYLLAGEFDHQDPHGGGGTIGPGDVQWMTAGAGILHIETPSARLLADGGDLWGVQLWVNLPAADKLAAARYQHLPADRLPRTRRDGWGPSPAATPSPPIGKLGGRWLTVKPTLPTLSVVPICLLVSR
jgi:hypothetical protein